MKNIFSFILCAACALSLFGCVNTSPNNTNVSPDACAGITCQNGGICNNGSCVCPTGYQGTYCQTETAGDLLFWADAGTLDTAVFITVYIDTAGANSSSAIIHAATNVTSCDAEGAAFIPTATGILTYKAVANSGGHIWRGTVAVTNACQTIQLHY